MQMKGHTMTNKQEYVGQRLGCSVLMGFGLSAACGLFAAFIAAANRITVGGDSSLTMILIAFGVLVVAVILTAGFYVLSTIERE